MALKTELNTPDMAARIQEAFDASDFAFHDNAKVAFDGGQHYVNCLACGAMWSVEDAEGPGTIDGFNFEEMEDGDESCNENNTTADEECDHPNAVESDPEDPPTWYCPDCGETFIYSGEDD